MNLLGAAAVVLSVVMFAVAYHWLRGKSWAVRLAAIAAFGVLSMPALLFAVYYLHVLPERQWFFELRAWPGSEFLVLFLGCAAGAVASILPRWLLGFPLFGLVLFGVVPYLKPIMGPLPDADFRDTWRDGVCLQSTSATCGPASISTILKSLGVDASEREAARQAHTYVGGTEAWYLARYVRSKGLVPRFEFRETFSPEVGLPAMVGVRIGGMGHFIAILGMKGDQITVADPLVGVETMTLKEFKRRFQTTGFHLVVSKA